MRVSIWVLLAILSNGVQASMLSESTARVCMSVPAYAELRMPEKVTFEPIAKSLKGASKRFRALDQMELEANVPVRLVASVVTLSNGEGSYTPDVYIDNQSGIVDVPYASRPQLFDLKMDMNLPMDEIQKAGDYEGSFDVIVMADLEVGSCL